MSASPVHACTAFAPPCVCVWVHTHPRRNVRARSVGVDRVRFVSQAFYFAKAFNVNIGAWNVLRVTAYSSNAFESSGLADCIKRGVHDNWGATLRTAYPTWSSLSAVCATPAPSTTPSTATPRYAGLPERVISSPRLAADFDSCLRTRSRLLAWMGHVMHAM